MNISFEDRTVLITGAAHGFGRALALRFAALGANVFACDVMTDGLEETRALADSAGCVVDVARVDVTHRQAVDAWVKQARARFGSLDVIVNNAGGVLGQVGQPIESVSSEDWTSIFRVNLDGAFHTTAAAAPTFKEAGRGRIVSIASGAGLGISLTGIQAYAAAKAALIGFTRQMAHEFGHWGVTVNCVAPGFVRSNPTTERQWQSYGTEGQANLLEGIALKRLGSPDDIANAVLFFASEEAGWITGQTLSVDGGR